MIVKMEGEMIEALLRSNHVGRIGCITADGLPYIVPVTYVYADDYIYGRAHEGMKVSAMRDRPHVCFEVDEIQDMAKWKSVITWGDYEELQGEDSKRGFEVMLHQLAPYATSATFGASSRDLSDFLSRGFRISVVEGVVYRIHLTKKTGRMEKPLGVPAEVET